MDSLQSNKYLLWPGVIVFATFGLDLFSSFPGASVVLIKSVLLGAILVASFFILALYKKAAVPLFSKIIYVYFFLLAIRIFNDFIVEGQYFFMYQHSLTIVSFFLLTMVIPIWIFSSRRFELNFDKLLFFIQFLTLVVLSISIWMILTDQITAINGGRFNGVGMLDTIYFGHHGLTLFILSLYKFKVRRIFNTVCACIGILTIFLAGSRGPMVAFCVCMLLFLIIKSNNLKTKVLTALIVSIVLIFYAPILTAINDIFMSHGFYSFNRITMYLLGGMDGGNGREEIYAHAYNLINDNPLFGYHYLLEDGSYVHNIFIEQFMALGYFGGAIFAVAVIYIAYLGYKEVTHSDNDGFLIFYILFIQYIMFGMFSRTIIALPQLWITMSVVIHYSTNRLLYGR